MGMSAQNSSLMTEQDIEKILVECGLESLLTVPGISNEALNIVCKNVMYREGLLNINENIENIDINNLIDENENSLG